MLSFIRKHFITLLLLPFLLLPFMFSLQDAPTSKGLSNFVLDSLLEIPFFSSSPIFAPFRQDIRSMGHILLFFFITLVLIVLLSYHNYSLSTILWVCPLVICIIAIADETLQLFIPGRAFELIDIAKDMFGCLLALTLYSFFHLLRFLLSLLFSKSKYLFHKF